MRPRIAVTPDLTLDESKIQLSCIYYQAVEACGGIPYIAPYIGEACISQMIEEVDGILLTGGDDVDPTLFHEQPQPGLGIISPIRDRGEVMLCKMGLQKQIPILGICRGLQVLAVAAGGTVIQDIYTGDFSGRIIKHMQQAPRWYPTHGVALQENTKLRDIYKKEQIYVNSFHHQAVGNPGADMIVSAKSQDGIIEGIEHITHPYAVGVQWHPECMTREDLEQQRLFRSFIEAAKRRQKDRRLSTGCC